MFVCFATDFAVAWVTVLHYTNGYYGGHEAHKKLLIRSETVVWLPGHDRLPEGYICFLIDDVIEDLKLAPAARGNTVLGAPT